MPKKPKCVLTGYYDDGVKFIPTDGSHVEYKFDPVGRVKMSNQIYSVFEMEHKTHPILAGICRNRFEEGDEPIFITADFLQSVDTYPHPKKINEKGLHLLKYMYNRGGSEYKDFDFHAHNDYPLCYCVDEDEFDRVMHNLYDIKRFVKYHGKQGDDKSRYCIVMTDSGIREVEKGLEKGFQISDDTIIALSGVENKNVFIVHGRNDGIKEAVARTIHRIGLNPIILHEQANRGKTLIEKFEHYSNVGFAIILLTDDDLGKGKDEEELRKRARQNVVFEMGFFFGKLSRSKVVTLYSKGTELPSDLDGLVYIELDQFGKWKHDMAKELHQAGYSVDFSKL